MRLKTPIAADIDRTDAPETHAPGSPPAVERRSPRSLGAPLALALLAGATSGLVTGCISDPDCGVCDPDRLVLEIMSGTNYGKDQIFVLNPECEGEKCPAPKKKGKYFVNQVLPCLESDRAEADGRAADEYCRISPLISFSGLEFVFNNLLDPKSVELVRRRPDDPSLFEVYDWKDRIAHIEGPITRFNGDYRRGGGNNPDVMTRSVNLSCIENLDERGLLDEPYHEAVLADPNLCNQVDWNGDLRPLKMRAQEADGSPAITRSRVGSTDWKAFSCSTPEEGPDTCCTVCDYELSVNVAKYGLSAPWNPEAGANVPELREAFEGLKVRFPDAIACTADGSGNKYVECRDFIPGVFREDEDFSYSYIWEGTEPQVFNVPRYDKLRETHPDDRPQGLEQLNIACDVDQDCPSGAACIGEDPAGNACSGTTDCDNRSCRQSWFVDCVAEANTTGAQGYCIDRRFRDTGAGACYTFDNQVQVTTSTGQTATARAGDRLALCDTNENNFLSAEECCIDELGGSGECDPIYSQAVSPIARFDRDRTLPAEFRDCFCGDLSRQRESCAEQVAKFCAPPFGNGPIEAGAYVTRFVSRLGGVVYDPALKGVQFLPADLGNYRRARVERCAEAASPTPSIPQRSILDGWRAGDSGRAVETDEDFDRAMCSGAEYKVVFSTERGTQRIEDKVGNTLAGKDTYVFQTPQFHVVPRSGFPTDNLQVGGCDQFELSFSNKFDLDPENVEKVQLWEVERVTGDGCTAALDEFSSDPRCWVNKRRVAGGPDCTPDDRLAVDDGDAVPCLVVDARDQFRGVLRARVDSVVFGRQLFQEGFRGSTGRYRMVVPGLNRYDANMRIVQEFSSLEDLREKVADEAERDAIYQGAFLDACGMPLVTAGMKPERAPDYLYDFTIDQPKCVEDSDFDGVQISCDNANQHTNPEQFDDDSDGFGNIVDRCVLTSTSTNTDDADRDGIGTACDNCRRARSFYNVNDAAIQDVTALQVRNNPRQDDSDQDGIGDACDNCPTVPNCQNFGNGPGQTPYTLNTPIQDDNNNVCQTDNDTDMVGDVCAGTQPNPDAAGPIGTGETDDFDQDGIDNASDFCPRLPVAPQACTTDADCPENAPCEPSGVCNHVDSDGDFVGDVCDTCAFVANSDQVLFGGAAMDDPDGDFVGTQCETNTACSSVIDPQPYSFYEVSVNGLCCTTTYPGDGTYEAVDEEISETGFVCLSPERGGIRNGIMCDPDGLPISLDCDNEPEEGQARIPDGTLCRRLPLRVAERVGVVNLPPGCDLALADAGISAAENVQLSLADATDEVELWSKMCFLPQWDQDFDGLGDACDLCPFAFDPRNLAYTNETTGQLLPDFGAFCNGDYDIENSPRCIQPEDDAGGTGGTGGTDGGTTN